MTNMSAQINEIALALSKAQSELESAKKENTGYGYNYSDLATVIDAAKKVLSKHNLAISQLLTNGENNNPAVTTILMHSSGQFLSSTIGLASIEMKGCNPVQGAGATLSYLRRYSLQAILGMASEDPDASSEGINKEANKQNAQTKAAPPASTSFRRTAAAPTQAASKEF